MNQEHWLDTAVSGVRFAPDRKKVRRELEEHIEDKTADLRRVFPDIPEPEARDRALAGMGDPEEIKTALAKVHKPWLGWLWLASHRAVVLLSVALSVVGMSVQIEGTFNNSLRGRTEVEAYGPIQDGEQARLGQYTFRITAAAYLDTPEDGVRKDNLQLVLRASSPRFWERLSWEGFYNSLTAVGPDGTRYPMDRQEILMKEDEGIYQVYTGATPCRWDVFWREVAVYLPAEGWQPGDTVTLELDSRLGKVSLSAAVTERTVIP